MVTDGPDGAVLVVRVVSRAGRDEVDGVRDGALVVRLAAPPVENAANDALVRVLADRLGLPRRAIAIVTGMRSRSKHVRIAGLTAAEVRRRLAGDLPSSG